MMGEYRYKKIDAFTSGNSNGNPAACIYLEPGQRLTEREMQLIARQHKGFVSEMVYLWQEEEKLTLAYYSSECEVNFCGHGTIACMYSLIRQDPKLMNLEELTISAVRKGDLTVYNKINDQNAVYITAPQPEYHAYKMSKEYTAAKLGLNLSDLSELYPIEVIDAGLKTLIVPIERLSKEISIYPQEQVIKHFCVEHGIDIILVYTLQVKEPGRAAHTRVFAPKFGYLEDPATGSGNSAFGYYMLKHGLWSGEPIAIEQGGDNIEFNEVRLMVKDGKVLFGGAATDRIVGTYLI
jgi:PhzF family phenazine biosynthesis protein